MSIQKRFVTEIAPQLRKDLQLDNHMELPKLCKIVVNIGLGEAMQDKKVLEQAGKQLAVITGQKPLVTRAKRAIATFKLRAGMPIGLKVTLRGKRMYDFFEKLVGIVLVRTRDFRGVSETGFDESGNYSLGFSEQIVFPEVDYNTIDKVRGLEVTIVTSATNKVHARALLSALGMPFIKLQKE